MEYLKYFITEEIYILPPKADVTPELNVSPETNHDPAPRSPDVKPDSPEYPASIISHELNDDDKKLLNDILTAVKLDPKKVQHINAYKDISADMVIIFGSFPELQSLPRYQIVAEDTKEILLADELSIIARDVSKKKLLWASLKEMFRI
jgi:DNA polymerase III psi subunit